MKGDEWVREPKGIKNYIDELIENLRLIIHKAPIFYFKGVKEGVEVEITFTYTDSDKEIIKSFVNNFNTHEGGTHVSGFRSVLTREINRYTEKYDSVENRSYGVKLSGSDIIQGILAIISIKHSDPQLGGYSKTKLENSDVERIVQQIIKEPLQEFMKNNQIFKRAILEKAKVAQDIRVAVQNLGFTKQKQYGSLSFPGRLILSHGKDPFKRELYIIDGQSAGGTAVKARNSEFQEILFIRVNLDLNERNQKNIIEQADLDNILTILDLGPNNDLAKCRYGKIFLLIEPRHIDLLILLLKYFCQNMRSLIEASRLYIVFSPVYRVKATGKLGKFLDDTKNSLYELITDKYFTNNTELQSFKNYIKYQDISIDDLLISKFHGMDELNADQFDEAIMSPDSRKIQQISKSDVEDELAIDILLKDLRIQLTTDRLNREYLSTPNAQDGLKPIHRRFLLAMNSLSLNYDSIFKRSSRILGELFGKYHQIQEWAYESIVKLGQEWYSRYPFANFMGNIGSIDGLPPVEMRFTEVRPFKIGTLLTKDLSLQITDFVYNFYKSVKEPLVLPSPFPNLLINGGFDPSIPTHNLVEVLNACITLMENPHTTTDELITIVKGPDYPTGGIIVGIEGIKPLYEIGKGSYILRSRSHYEDTTYGIRLLVIDEIPYLVSKAEILTQISQLIDENSLPGLRDVRDLSKHDIRIEIEFREGVPLEAELALLAQLFVKTDLAIKVDAELFALHEDEVASLNLKEALQIFLEFREKCIANKTKAEFEVLCDRIHILEGNIVACNNIEKFIQIIVPANNLNDAKGGLMEEFNLSSIQVKSILSMNIAELIESELNAELTKLELELEELSQLISERGSILSVMENEFRELISEFADNRRTDIVEQDDLIFLSADGLIETNLAIQSQPYKKRDLLITTTSEGYLRAIDYIKYQQQGRDRLGVIMVPLGEDEQMLDQLVCNNLDILLLITNRGIVHHLHAYEIPEVARRTSRGIVIKRLLPVEGIIVKIVNVTQDHLNHDYELVITTHNSLIEKTSLDKFVNLEPIGLSGIILKNGDEILDAYVGMRDE